jgi:hypothetical protein
LIIATHPLNRARSASPILRLGKVESRDQRQNQMSNFSFHRTHMGPGASWLERPVPGGNSGERLVTVKKVRSRETVPAFRELGMQINPKYDVFYVQTPHNFDLLFLKTSPKARNSTSLLIFYFKGWEVTAMCLIHNQCQLGRGTCFAFLQQCSGFDSPKTVCHGGLSPHTRLGSLSTDT